MPQVPWTSKEGDLREALNEWMQLEGDLGRQGFLKA